MSADSDQKRHHFAQKMSDILNYGAINLAMGIGYRTGLFDIMDRCAGPASAQFIAQEANLSGRYVQEWLGVMVCAGIIDLVSEDKGQDLFSLPTEHGDLITRRAGNANMGVYTQEIPLLTQSALEGVVHGFQTGEGVGYDTYPTFQALMGQPAQAKHRQTLVDTFLPSVDQGEILQRLREGIRVCDIGCARGVAVILMASAFPRSEFLGMDIDPQALTSAREEAHGQGLHNASFIQQDAADPSFLSAWQESFDYITAFDAIHDQTRPAAALRGVFSMLKPGGLFSMVDIAASSRLADNTQHPMGPFLYTVSLMHCLPVGLVHGGAGLGMMWGRQKAVAMLSEAGFHTIQEREIPDDPFNLHFESRK